MHLCLGHRRVHHCLVASLDHATSIRAPALTCPGASESPAPCDLTLMGPPPSPHTQLLAALNVTSATELLAAPELVTTVLSYHVLPTAQSLAEFSDGEELETALGGDEVLTVSRTQVLQKEAPYFGYNIQLVSTGGVLPVAQVVKGDILTSEATIVHVSCRGGRWSVCAGGKGRLGPG